MKLAPLATLLCVLPLAGCYVVQYPGGALALSPNPVAPQAMRAAPGSPGSADVSTAPVPTPSVSTAPVRSSPTASPVPPPPAGTAARLSYPNNSPVPPDYRPPAQQAPRTPVYPNGSPVPPDYVPPPTSQVPSGNVAYAPAPGYATYSPSPYVAYPAYSAYPAYAAYPAYPAYAPFYPAFGPSPWVSNVSLSFSWGRGWGGWGGRCCYRWR